MPSIKRKKLSDLIIEEIKNRIIKGSLKEGDKLPNQNMFAAELGVSRPSLREAMQTLSLMGVIEQGPRIGTIIRSDNPELWSDNIIPPLVSDTKSTLELIAVRRYIELGTAEMAVEKATKKDLQKLERLIERMKTALEKNKVKDYTNLDLGFHHAIAVASHNRYMLHMFNTIRQLMGQFIFEAFSVLPDLLDRSAEFHVNIYNGIKKRDKKSVMLNMNKHIQDIETTLMDFYKKKR